MIKAGRPRWRRLPARAFPSVQPNVMVIAAGGDKRRLRAVPLCKFKAQQVAVKRQRPFEVGHFQMYMADANTGDDGSWGWFGAHSRSLARSSAVEKLPTLEMRAWKGRLLHWLPRVEDFLSFALTASSILVSSRQGLDV